MKKRRRFLALCLVLAWAAALAQYPRRPLRLIVPFPPGGAVDVLGRAISQNARDTIGQNIVVDNRAGAAGAVGSEIAVRSAPDGYTLLMGSTSTISINPVLFSKLAYHPIKDFAPITQVAFVPHLLIGAGDEARDHDDAAHAKAHVFVRCRNSGRRPHA
jgi:tripartite-type tricarboxylate transporter receptor subunit TctC